MIKQFHIWHNPTACEVTQKQTNDFAMQNKMSLIDELLLSESNAIFEFIGEQLVLNLLLDQKPTQLSFSLDAGSLAYRRGKANLSNEVIAKAIGCKPNYRPRVFDATAGMGRDALIMAQLGCHVKMLERNFAIYHLLNNALLRLQSNPSCNEISERMQLNHKDSLQIVSELKDIDVIYLDPMFPERKKSALVKKEMRLFKRLTGDDSDSANLFNQATRSQAKRIVVKRPKDAARLTDLAPNHEILGKQFRYDVYLTELFC